MKLRRQQLILDLISKERLSSQFQIRERLADLGVEATQSTISRDIEELGLAKVHDQGGLRYVTPASLNRDGGGSNGNGVRGKLRRLLQEYVLDMTPSGNLLVVLTPPGAAHLLGEEPLEAFLERVETAALHEALAQTGHNKTAAAKLLGMSFRSLRYKLDKFGIE